VKFGFFGAFLPAYLLKEGANATETEIIAFCRRHISGFNSESCDIRATPEDIDR